MDQPDDIDPVRVLRHAQTQILNYDLIVSLLDQSFRVLELARRIDVKTMLGKIFTHGKTDRLFIIDDKQPGRAWFCAIRNCDCRWCPAAEKLAQATGYSFECQHCAIVVSM